LHFLLVTMAEENSPPIHRWGRVLASGASPNRNERTEVTELAPKGTKAGPPRCLAIPELLEGQPSLIFALSGNMNTRIIEGALDRLRPGWRERQAKRKSPWNPACAFVGLSISLPAWYWLFQAAWRLHVAFYPAHAGLRSEFWGEGISGQAFASSFVMPMPLAVPAITFGFLSGNLVFWLIPPARRAMEREAAGDSEMTFAGSNTGLITWGV
jgi:hypothetical protein